MKKGWKNFWITCGVVAGIGCVPDQRESDGSYTDGYG